MLVCLLWSSPAWKLAARDQWIGWNVEQRVRNLQLILNQRRFWVLPWVEVKGLASKILAKNARHLPSDWERWYGYQPLLLETLVDPQRFRGTCYRAANWIRVGQTSGRGRMDWSTKLMAKWSKISAFTRWGATRLQRLRSRRTNYYADKKQRNFSGNSSA